MPDTLAERVAAQRRREFVGRAEEVAALRALLEGATDGAVLFVFGPGGVGKTTLLGRYAEVGCRRIHVWPLGDEAQQLERLMSDVLPRATPSPPSAWPRRGAGPRSS